MNIDDCQKLTENLSNHEKSAGVSISEPSQVAEVDLKKNLDNIDSIHSRTKEDDEKKSWDTLHSIHSKAIKECYDESNSSYASFGDSSSSDVGNTIEEVGKPPGSQLAFQSRQFQSLGDVPNPRAIMMKQQSLRLQRGASYRGTLSLIDESED